MIAKIARVLVLVMAAHVFLPSAYAFKPGPALAQQAKRNQALKRVLLDFHKHHRYVRIRTSDGDIVEGHATDVNDDGVVLDGRSRERVPLGSINKVYVNNFLSKKQVALIIAVAIIVVAVASVPKE